MTNSSSNNNLTKNGRLYELIEKIILAVLAFLTGGGIADAFPHIINF